MLQDLYPTVLVVLGVETTHDVDGRYLLPDLDGSPAPARQEPRRLLYQAVWEARCLARAIFVIDGAGTVKHVEYVSEIAEHPNYEAALAAAK